MDALQKSLSRALLHTTSLFPIGSFVELSDGRIGRVFRSNGATYDRPVVEAWQPARSIAAPKIINLLDADTLCVMRPLPHLEMVDEGSVPNQTRADVREV